MIKNLEEFPPNIIESIKMEDGIEEQNLGTGINLVLPGDLITEEKGYMQYLLLGKRC